MGEQDDPPVSNDMVPSEPSEVATQDYYEPLEHISPLQQRFVMMQVTTTMSPIELGRVLGVSDNVRRSWQKDEHVEAYLTQLKRRYNDSEMIAVSKAQNKFIRENMFNEVFQRFQNPEEALREWIADRNSKGLPEPSIDEIIGFKDRFAATTSFKDMMKIWEKVDKQSRLDAGEPTNIHDDKSFENRVRKRYLKYHSRTKSSKEFSNIAKDAGSLEEYKAALEQAEEAEFESLDPEDAPSEPDVIEAELVEDDDEEWETTTEISLEEWEITRG